MRMWTLDKNCLVLTAALLACSGASAANPAPPATSVGFNQLTIAGEECERRATLALTAEGFSASAPAAGTYYGTKGIHSAYILCKPGPNGNSWATVFVASNATDGNLPGRERQNL